MGNWGISCGKSPARPASRAVRETRLVFPSGATDGTSRSPGRCSRTSPPSQARDLGLDYLQDLRNFEEIEDDVRNYFSPRPDVWRRLAARFDGILSLPHKTSLHVRRGDYVGHNGFFANLPVAYYMEAMSLTQGPYLVFSDDIPWCRSNLPGDCVFMENNRDYEDLFLMAACDEHIVANSTFSWWGAWIGGGHAILPREWGTGLRCHRSRGS